MVVAKRDLPKRYMTALYGEIIPMSFMSYEDEEWGFETPDSDFINPKKYPGSQTQYMQCPGPNEVVTSGFAPNPNLFMTEAAIESLEVIRKEYKKSHKTAMVENKKKGIPEEDWEMQISQKAQDEYAKMQEYDFEDTHGCMTFLTTKEIPKNHQLVMMYADSEKAANEFFKSRGMTRCDVWTAKYPTLLKKKADVKNLLTIPPKEDKVTADQSRSAKHWEQGVGLEGAKGSSSSSSSSAAMKKDTKKNVKEVAKGNDKKPMKVVKK